MATPAEPPPAAEMHEGAPLERRVFDTWDEFHEYMEAYARRSFQLFRKRTSTSVKLRNRRVAERSAARAKPDADGARLIPEEYGNYSLTLVCTHSGAFVSRGTGRRSRQDVRAMHCNVQVNACLKLADPAANRYEVTVTRALLTHNHRVDKETFLQYSNTRLNLSDDLLGCVELMRKTGVKPKDVRSYITENSNCAPTLKDVQNILQRLRNSEDAASASAVAANGDGQEARARSHESPSDTKLSVFGATPALGPQDEVLCGYRAVASAATTNKAPEPMDPTTQFKVAHAMGKAVASLLAEIPAAEFAGAFQVLEVAASIVKKRQAEAAARAGATSATRTGSNGEDDGNETATDVDSTLHVAGASVAPVDDPWARSL